MFATCGSRFMQPILNKRQIKTNYEISLANQEKAYLAFRKSILNAGNEASDALKMYNAQDQFIALKKKRNASL